MGGKETDGKVGKLQKVIRARFLIKRTNRRVERNPIEDKKNVCFKINLSFLKSFYNL